MGKAITEKILSDHSEQKDFKPGDIIDVKVDFLLTNDISGPVAVQEFEKMGDGELFDNNRVAIVLDHFTPNKDVVSANVSKTMRDFAKSKGITHFYDAGYGIEHVILPKDGMVKSGDLVIGGDSHTTTYGALGAFSTGVGSTDVAGIMALGTTWLRVPEQMKFVLKGKPDKWINGKDIIVYIISKIGTDGALGKSMEITGDGVKYFDMDSRFTICNMGIEAGALNCIFNFDEITEIYEKNAGVSNYKIYKSDEDAEYDYVMEINLEELQPMVAAPHMPSNGRPVTELSDVNIDQVVIGSCTNGRIGDLRTAAQVVKGKKVSPNVRALLIPGSREVYLMALREGLIEIFTESGFTVCSPSCGPCFGGHLGILGRGERCVSTTNRNFVGRMGDKSSEVYLASPAVAAATAITGKITSPTEVA
ncbi:3-isopropylmalate dehydratase large subunit [Calorimonas adulescens]|uniref:3-isopropylmalate dehydratase large subunit n=1 Tax=Calorimonas adulescens TaxID=2606906 RepID=A0A5D8QBJ3_9THEO|nr:3-isopropylmalate dehydratase large subunit [Calorimonas adulescens]TZE81514.1 3-isopropylmalate dehydratase large subunit [Calorimonas adulescens]